MTKEPQIYNLSVRIGELLNAKLEEIRGRYSKATGEKVSTSEIAKKLLESARLDQVELLELLRAPTPALLTCRLKKEEGIPLSRAEWSLMAQYAVFGVDAFTHNPQLPSRESLLDLVRAFGAVYNLVERPSAELAEIYRGNLPPLGFDNKGRKRGDANEEIRHAIGDLIDRLNQPRCNLKPRAIATNLLIALSDEHLPGADALNAALMPYWNGLWRLAGRGHWAKHKQPITKPSAILRRDMFWSFEPLSAGDFRLFMYVTHDAAFSIRLELRPHVWQYLLKDFPKIADFQQMLMAMERTQNWQGASLTCRVEDDRDNGRRYIVGEHESGLVLQFSQGEWNNLCDLFHRAWGVPQLKERWEELCMQYGEY